MNNNEKAMHVAAAAAGAALAYYGFKKGGVAGNLVGVMGAGLATSRIAAAAGLPVGSAEPREVRQSVEVMATPEEAFEMWSRFEDFPRFMKNVREVRKIGENSWHWVVEGPFGQRVEWDAVLTASEPGKLIAWTSTSADVANSGEVRFELTKDGTSVLVTMRYGQPIGPIGIMIEKIAGGDPDAMVRQDLRCFKQLIEAGEIAVAPQLWQPEKMRLTEEIAQ